MTNEMKETLFKLMLELEHKSEAYCEGKTYDGRNYNEQACGAFYMIEALGLQSEYVNWAEGK